MKIVISSIYSALSIAIGAFGAHGLNPILTLNSTIHSFETASKYHLFVSVVLIVLSFIEKESTIINKAFYGLLTGNIVFSFSLYILAITNIKVLGAITPVGGMIMILSFYFLVKEGLNRKKQ
jgi:uncharacterized membrane protein YgdD (TMEM256/DUF423 family)